MADTSLNPLADWCAHLKGPRQVHVKEIQDRLSAIGPLNWRGPDGQALLEALLPRLSFRKSDGTFHLPALRCLDELKRAGAFPAAWTVPFTPYLGKKPTILAARLLATIPPASHLTPPAEQRWLGWACQAILETPRKPSCRALLESPLRAHVLNEAVNAGHDRLALAIVGRWPETFQASDPLDGTLWLNARSKPHAWSWALAQGLDPLAQEKGVGRPFWWRACDQGCRAAGNWALTHAHAGAVAYQVDRYFKRLVSECYSEEASLDRLIHRSDWSTLKNEHGDAALWVACHHHLWLTRYGPRPEIKACPNWVQAVDRNGRNLAFAVLTSPDSHTSNAAKAESLRYLAMHRVHVALDGQGRGVAISWPDLTAAKDVVEMAQRYPGERRWWQGTSEQVEQAIATVAHSSPANWEIWKGLLDAVPAHNPKLQVLKVVLEAVSILSPNPIVVPSSLSGWPRGLHDSPLWQKGLASAHGPLLEAHRRQMEATSLASSPSSLRTRPRP